MRGMPVVASAVFVLFTSGCGVSLQATQLAVVVGDGGITYARTGDAALVAGGETVLRIRNESESPARLVLVRSGADPQDLPVTVRNENPWVAGDMVVASTAELDAQEAAFATGGLGYKIDRGSMHVYLDPDEVYLLLDAESPLDAPRYLRITPVGGDAR